MVKSVVTYKPNLFANPIYRSFDELSNIFELRVLDENQNWDNLRKKKASLFL